MSRVGLPESIKVVAPESPPFEAKLTLRPARALPFPDVNVVELKSTTKDGIWPLLSTNIGAAWSLPWYLAISTPPNTIDPSVPPDGKVSY